MHVLLCDELADSVSVAVPVRDGERVMEGEARWLSVEETDAEADSVSDDEEVRDTDPVTLAEKDSLGLGLADDGG